MSTTLSNLDTIITILITVTVPLVFSTTMLAFAIWGISTRGRIKRIILFSMLTSAFTDLLYYQSHYVRFGCYAVLTVGLLILLFRSASVWMRIVISITCMVLYLIAELVGTLFMLLFVSKETMTEQSPLFPLSHFWSLSLLILLCSIWLESRKYGPGTPIRALLTRKRDWKIPLLLVFFLLQIILVIWQVIVRTVGSTENNLIDSFLLLVLAISMATLALIVKIVAETRNEAIKSTQLHYIDDINRMFTTVRGQRHDFMNHVQVISSFVRMKKMDDLERYTQELVGETSEINEIMSIGNPALAALVQAKCAIAVSLKIQFEYDCSGFNSRELGPKSIDLVKVIGNVLDNAFDEVVKLPQEQRFVRLQCGLEHNELHISVHNKGTYIPEDIRSKLFEAGFSTKAGAHRGLGLSIVKERLTYYNGTIEVQSDPVDGTAFHVKIPVKKLS
ncbi:sensor histidine kinase [Paenibacillus koleovorans]|uniref:sensor histidine kinase n=1 Tax=Paenibacillus koleovorans TaxID=121608 RepID=UPI000FDB30DB|nr:ATP-binding protein [Paenibacillus koleovorans]